MYIVGFNFQNIYYEFLCLFIRDIDLCFYILTIFSDFDIRAMLDSHELGSL